MRWGARGGGGRTRAVSAQEQRFGARRRHVPAVHVEAPFLGQKPALNGRGRGLGFLHHRGFVHLGARVQLDAKVIRFFRSMT